MFSIKNITWRKVLNSHVLFTNEFIIELVDGSIGTGASPQGETISIYEDRKVTIDPTSIIQKIKEDGILGQRVDQNEFDDYLHKNIAYFGRNNCFGLSLAFFKATSKSKTYFELFDKPKIKMTAPHICFNILNGGWHAYTNPVLSDFSEFMLVAKSSDPEEVITDHNEIQAKVKELLLHQNKTAVAGNPVNSFATSDNRECLDFLLGICNDLGLSNKFELMIDASASDLWTKDGYHLSITDNSVRSSEQFYEYWMDLIKQYHIRFLEDPFHETDFDSWQRLTNSQQEAYVIGDNLYSSDAGRIKDGSLEKYTHGVVTKPNQAGTVSAVRRAIDIAQENKQIVITSHRSISTESTFLSLLTCIYNVKYIKIGPLMTDYSSVIRLNEIIRLAE
jgi:enolase